VFSTAGGRLLGSGLGNLVAPYILDHAEDLSNPVIIVGVVGVVDDVTLDICLAALIILEGNICTVK